jgi:hypothetical protein
MATNTQRSVVSFRSKEIILISILSYTPPIMPRFNHLLSIIGLETMLPRPQMPLPTFTFEPPHSQALQSPHLAPAFPREKKSIIDP